MKVRIISIVVGVLDTVTKGLIQGVEDLEIMGQFETVQTTALLRSARILRLAVTQISVKNSHGVKDFGDYVFVYHRHYVTSDVTIP